MAYREVSRVEIAEVVRRWQSWHQPARYINWYGAVASDSAQVHRGGRGGGAGPGRSCSE